MIHTVDKYRIIHSMRSNYTVSFLCSIIDVSRSGYYKWMLKQKSPDRDYDLKQKIIDIYNKSKKVYGYRRIKATLFKNYKIKVNHKKIIRLMKSLNIKSLIRRKRFKYFNPKNIIFDKVEPNILNREFECDKPNTKWVTDITYLYYGKSRQRIYLSAIKDLYNNEIISYEMSSTLDVKFVLDTVTKAINNLSDSDKKSLLIHSDQGFHYTCWDYKNILKINNITQSMSRRGNCYDNASMENFFGHLKSEEIYLNSYTSRDDLETAVHSYIRWYNYDRLQSKLNSSTPIEYKRAA
ncbi:TPA: IS3 family transposase [Clostridioides difficile]|nr:transposase [Clostridioides difficile]